MSITSCLSWIAQLILLLLPVPKSIMMCCAGGSEKTGEAARAGQTGLSACAGKGGEAAHLISVEKHDGARVV